VYHTKLEDILESTKQKPYSKALKNYLYEYSENENIKIYFGLLRKVSYGIPGNIMDIIDKSFKKCSSTGIKYLILSFKLCMARVTGKKSIGKKLYLKLIREYGNIPISCRKSVARELKIHRACSNEEVKEFRTWSQKHIEDDYDSSFITITAAYKSLFKEGKSLEAFYKTFQESLECNQILLMIASLGNTAWELRHENIKKAYELSGKLCYYIGFYMDDEHDSLPSLDTILEVSKLNSDYNSFFETARIFDRYYEKIIKLMPDIKNIYWQNISKLRKYAFVRKKRKLKNDEIHNNKELRCFLKDKAGKTNDFAVRNGLSHASLYRIINGERNSLKVKTLKQIVKALALDYSFKYPKEINYVTRIMKIEEKFEMNIKKMYRLSDRDLKYTILRGIFISIPDEKINRARIFSMIENREKLTEYLKRDISGKEFINRCFDEENSYYNGRSDLFDKVIEILEDEADFNKITSLYSCIKTDEGIELLNRYLREYARYSIHDWDFDAQVILKNRYSDPDYDTIASFCKRLNMSEIHGYLCTWFFEGEDRRSLIDDIISLR